MIEREEELPFLSNQEILDQLKPGNVIEDLQGHGLIFFDLFVKGVADALIANYPTVEGEKVNTVNRVVSKNTASDELRVKGFLGKYLSPRLLVIPPRSVNGMRDGFEPESVTSLMAFANLYNSGRGITRVVAQEFCIYLRKDKRKGMTLISAFKYSRNARVDSPDKLEKRLLGEAIESGYDLDLQEGLIRAVRLGLSSDKEL